jgi:histone-lysine N-methyltransferase SETMAR
LHHLLSDESQKFPIVGSKKALRLPGLCPEPNFEGIALGDEFWFECSSYSNSMFADSRESVGPRIQRDISAPKTMIPIFSTSKRLLVLEALPKGTKFNQDYFIQCRFPRLYPEKRGISRKTRFPAFSVHMDNSMCHTGRKVSAKFVQRSIERVTHPPYSPDISPCDFWLFRILKHNMKDREFQSQQAILNAIATIRDEVTFENLQRVFQEWMGRLAWVIGNNGESSPNSRHYCRKWLTVVEVGLGGQDFFYPPSRVFNSPLSISICN